MNRRQVLEGGTALTAAGWLAFAQRAKATDEKARNISAALAQGFIWCRNDIPVPVRQDGTASGIADVGSQGKTQGNDFFNDRHAAFLKSFTVVGDVAKAELHIFAHTRYRLYVNGEYVGRGPARYQTQRPEYDSWDVAARLKPGVNRIGVLVHRDSPTGRIMYHAPGLTVLLNFRDDRRWNQVRSDESWRARAEKSFQSRDIAWGSIPEVIDARLTHDWISNTYNEAPWPLADRMPAENFVAPQPRTIPLLRETVLAWQKPFRPVDLGEGEAVTLPLASVTLGYHRLAFHAAADSRLEVDYLLPDGGVDGKGVYIAREGEQVWEGGDSFAFSSLRITVKSGRIRLAWAEAIELVYPFDLVGAFSCSDDFLNRLWALCARSLKLLSEDAYVDCADRERVEWIDNTPPAFECTRVLLAGPGDGRRAAYSDPRLLKALLQRIALTQRPDGQVKAHSCSERWDIHAIMEDRSCDWVIALRQYYDATGDAEFVHACWPTLQRLLDWFLERKTARGLVIAREWEVWDNPLRYQVCEGAGLNAFVFHALRDAAYLAESLLCKVDARRWNAAGDELAAAFNNLLWDEDVGAYSGGLFGAGAQFREQLNGKVFSGPLDHGRYRPTLQAALFALDAGIVPKSRHARLIEWMLAHRQEATLSMSNYFLFKALYSLNNQQADEIVVATLHDKWKLMVESPWETSWEGLGYESGSKLHIYGISPAFFLSSYILGVRMDGRIGERRIIIDPRPSGLEWAKGIVVTEFGPVATEWKKSSDQLFVLTVSIPLGCQGVIPSARLQNAGERIFKVSEANGEIFLRPGVHRLTFRTE